MLLLPGQAVVHPFEGSSISWGKAEKQKQYTPLVTAAKLPTPHWMRQSWMVVEYLGSTGELLELIE